MVSELLCSSDAIKPNCSNQTSLSLEELCFYCGILFAPKKKEASQAPGMNIGAFSGNQLWHFTHDVNLIVMFLRSL